MFEDEPQLIGCLQSQSDNRTRSLFKAKRLYCAWDLVVQAVDAGSTQGAGESTGQGDI
ncbi:hypothetical protein IG631_11987 [Alternaria alternata]|jgi:hypothetical protein|nr:hypothetical protein IG631_11987 [Alternaria alternata]